MWIGSNLKIDFLGMESFSLEIPKYYQRLVKNNSDSYQPHYTLSLEYLSYLKYGQRKTSVILSFLATIVEPSPELLQREQSSCGRYCLLSFFPPSFLLKF